MVNMAYALRAPACFHYISLSVVKVVLKTFLRKLFNLHLDKATYLIYHWLTYPLTQITYLCADFTTRNYALSIMHFAFV